MTLASWLAKPRGTHIVRGVLVVVVLSIIAIQTIHTVHAHRYNGVGPICRVTTSERVVALSFDDGPDPDFTPRVLTLLASSGAKATFFVTGEHAAEYPDLIRRQQAAGMEIGNHTWSHPHLDALPFSRAMNEIGRGERQLARLGISARLFRAPYGRITVDQLTGLRRLGLTTIHWSQAVDRYVGSRGLTPAAAATTMSQEIRSGAIILAHDTPGPRREMALEALEHLLSNLQQRGYAVTTVGELLGSGGTVQAKGRPWFWQSGLACTSP